MEKEKLEDAKKTFEEDRDKFKKYMHDLNQKAVETAAEVTEHTNIKNDLIAKMSQLQAAIQKKKSKIKKIDEELIVFKKHKGFLDRLAINAKKKIPKEKKPVVQQKKTDSKQKLSIKENVGNTFMTQLMGGAAQKSKTKLEEKGVEEEAHSEPEEDSDFEIYFDKFTLLEHLTHLEEDNLFNIQLI